MREPVTCARDTTVVLRTTHRTDSSTGSSTDAQTGTQTGAERLPKSRGRREAVRARDERAASPYPNLVL